MRRLVVTLLGLGVVLTVAFARPVVHAADDGGYRLVPNWPTLPAGMYFGRVDPPFLHAGAVLFRIDKTWARSVAAKVWPRWQWRASTLRGEMSRMRFAARDITEENSHRLT